MKLPRDLTGKQLIKASEQMGYHVTRQTTAVFECRMKRSANPQVTVPLHNPLRVGTLATILADLASYHKLTHDELVLKLFGKN